MSKECFWHITTHLCLVRSLSQQASYQGINKMLKKALAFHPQSIAAVCLQRIPLLQHVHSAGSSGVGGSWVLLFRGPFLSYQKLCPAGNLLRNSGLRSLKSEFAHLSKVSALSLGKCSWALNTTFCVIFDVFYLTAFSCHCSCPQKLFIYQTNLQGHHFTENKLQSDSARTSRLL